MNSFGNSQPYQMVGTTQAYVDNSPVTAEIYQPQPVVNIPINLSGLVKGADSNRLYRPSDNTPVITATTPPAKKRGRKKKSETTGEDIKDKKPESTVESVVYADTYYDTNSLTYGVIAQTDELIRDCKQELDYVKSQRGLKGRHHYINATITSMGTLLNTKLAAIKEINSTIKNVNDNEYRRFKDFRMLNSADDNKAVMDAYTAFISAPVGAPEYHLPGTTNLTGGLNGIVQTAYPTAIQANMDAGLNHYLSNLTPEENLMLMDNNKDIEEVIVYDQATGAKYFQWMNTRTNEPIPNMPASSELTIEDFTIDPRTRLAKNNNLNCIKKVVVLNEGAFDKF